MVYNTTMTLKIYKEKKNEKGYITGEKVVFLEKQLNFLEATPSKLSVMLSKMLESCKDENPEQDIWIEFTVPWPPESEKKLWMAVHTKLNEWPSKLVVSSQKSIGEKTGFLDDVLKEIQHEIYLHENNSKDSMILQHEYGLK